MDQYNLDDFIQFVTPERLERMKEVLENRTRYMTIVMENLYNPHNTSAVIRSCEAFGVQDMHIIEKNNPFHVSTGVCQGSHNWVNLYKYKSTKEAVDNLHNKGYKVYFADPRPEYPDIAHLPLDNKAAIVFGQEKQGISPEMKELADGGVRIPLYGFVESFNVSVACAVSISTLIFRLREKMPERYFLTDEEKKAIMNHWLVKNTIAGKTLKKFDREKEYLLKEPFLMS